MNNIILIGFMGSGKTTFGKWIANNKNMIFCDTDELIEEEQSCSINEIFADKGEEYFRDLETDMLQKLIVSSKNAVISVGGGLPVRECNRPLLAKLGKCVYLNTSKEELVKRLKNDKTRPLLAGGGLEQKIASLMAARKDIYEETADIIIDTENKSFEQMYCEISTIIN